MYSAYTHYQDEKQTNDGLIYYIYKYYIYIHLYVRASTCKNWNICFTANADGSARFVAGA